MKTTIDNNQRKFYITEIGWGTNDYICNLKDIPKVIKEIADKEQYKIFEFWNREPKQVSKTRLNEMFEANQIKFRFKTSADKKIFKLSFVGRKVGAIGITYKIAEKVTARTIEEAINILYTKYEHITSLKHNGKKI